jgi:hypothetical protein
MGPPSRGRTRPLPRAGRRAGRPRSQGRKTMTHTLVADSPAISRRFPALAHR